MQNANALVAHVCDFIGKRYGFIVVLVLSSIILVSQNASQVSAQSVSLQSSITINGLSFDSMPSRNILKWVTIIPIQHSENTLITPISFTQNTILPQALTLSLSDNPLSTQIQEDSTEIPPSPTATATPVPTKSEPTPKTDQTLVATPTIVSPTPSSTPTPTPSPLPTPVVDPSSDAIWDQIAACESGGNWNDNTGNGYFGGLQFSQGAWNSVGGSGNPADASRADQIAKGKQLQAIRGWGAWEGCAKKLGLE